MGRGKQPWGFTHKRELAELVLMERPPADGAEVFGANMAIGMFKYHALQRNNNLLSCRRDKICGVFQGCGGGFSAARDT